VFDGAQRAEVVQRRPGVGPVGPMTGQLRERQDGEIPLDCQTLECRGEGMSCSESTTSSARPGACSSDAGISSKLAPSSGRSSSGMSRRRTAAAPAAARVAASSRP